MSNSSLKAMTGRQIKARRLAGRTALILMAALLTVAALGCYNIRTGRVDVGGAINFKLPAFTQTGPHAVDIFTEMHFQPSYRTQEGPRILRRRTLCRLRAKRSSTRASKSTRRWRFPPTLHRMEKLSAGHGGLSR